MTFGYSVLGDKEALEWGGGEGLGDSVEVSGILKGDM